jgi:hypothetical protein
MRATMLHRKSSILTRLILGAALLLAPMAFGQSAQVSFHALGSQAGRNRATATLAISVNVVPAIAASMQTMSNSQSNATPVSFQFNSRQSVNTVETPLALHSELSVSEESDSGSYRPAVLRTMTFVSE